MKKPAITYFCLIFSLACNVSAETYRSPHFIIYSDLDPRYIKILQANVEAFYDNLVGKFFKTGWSKPLEIYYSKNHSETFKLLCKHGHNEKGSNVKARASYYITKTQTIYTHQYYDNKRLVGIDVLFHEITHHFVRLNFPNVPTWFNEGLATFLGDETHIVKGKITLGLPHPWRDYRLKEQIEKGTLPNVRKLFIMNDRRLYSWPIGYHFSRAFFYWLYENKKLEQYLQNAQSDGYDLAVLEKTVNKPVSQINKELLAFIKTDCYAGAYLYESRRSNDPNQREQALLKALELKPRYARARLSLARNYYRVKDYKQARQYLDLILRDDRNPEYSQASELMGDCFQAEENYERALQYYQKALEYADFDEHKYELYYSIAQCYDNLKDRQKAEEFYQKFLAENWEQEKSPKLTKYASDYQSQEQNDSEDADSN
jgi:hypothetical protein